MDTEIIGFLATTVLEKTENWNPRNGDIYLSDTGKQSGICVCPSRNLTTFVDLKALERQVVGLTFERLASSWRRERNPLSSLAYEDLLCESYRRIIGLGTPALKFILEELVRELKESEPDQWFEALWAIAGEDPVPEESRGNMKAMAKAWLAWGIRQGYIDAETVGTALS